LGLWQTLYRLWRPLPRRRQKSNIQDLEKRLSNKEREVERLVGQLTVVSDQLTSEQESKAVQVRDLESRLAQMTAVADESRARISAMSDYETVKKELGIMRSLEFSSEIGVQEVNEAGGEERNNKPVEVLILERSKNLQSENTSLRMDKERLGRALDETAGELADKCREYERQSLLVAELEMHVDKLQQMNLSGGQTADDPGGRSSVDILRDISPSVNAKGAETPTLDTPTTPDQSSNMLPIVQAQRERYRQRNQELEEEKSNLQQQMSVVQSEAKQLSADNVKLYEKIRFLQGFGSEAKKAVQRPEANVEARYQTQYEQRLDPFTTFSNQERQKRYGNLNMVEKLILWMVRFMMSNKVARLMIFAYSVFLHMLVSFVLMRMAYSESHARQVAEGMAWKQKLEDHMMQQHNEHLDIPHG